MASSRAAGEVATASAVALSPSGAVRVRSSRAGSPIGSNSSSRSCSVPWGVGWVRGMKARCRSARSLAWRSTRQPAREKGAARTRIPWWVSGSGARLLGRARGQASNGGLHDGWASGRFGCLRKVVPNRPQSNEKGRPGGGLHSGRFTGVQKSQPKFTPISYCFMEISGAWLPVKTPGPLTVSSGAYMPQKVSS